MRILILTALLAAIGLGLAIPAQAGQCQTYCYGGDEYGRGRVCNTQCQ